LRRKGGRCFERRPRRLPSKLPKEGGGWKKISVGGVGKGENTDTQIAKGRGPYDPTLTLPIVLRGRGTPGWGKKKEGGLYHRLREGGAELD